MGTDEYQPWVVHGRRSIGTRPAAMLRTAAPSVWSGCDLTLNFVRWLARDGHFPTFATGSFRGHRLALMTSLTVRILFACDVARTYRPQKTVKAERFIQTALREWAYGRPYSHSNVRRAALKVEFLLEDAVKLFAERLIEMGISQPPNLKPLVGSIPGHGQSAKRSRS
jgi:hypothetical protein